MAFAFPLSKEFHDAIIFYQWHHVKAGEKSAQRAGGGRLVGTDLARAQCQTIRLRLLRIGAVVTRNTRTVLVRPLSCPDQAVFRLLVHRLAAE